MRVIDPLKREIALMMTVVMKLLIIIQLLVCSSSIIRGWGGKFNKFPNDQGQMVDPRIETLGSFWPQMSQKPSAYKETNQPTCYKRQCIRIEHCCDGTACIDINQGGK